MNKRKKYKLAPRFYVFLAIVLCILVGIIGLVATLVGGIGNGNGKQVDYQAHGLQGWKMAMSARAYISNDKLRYNDAYFAGGYPDENIGVCTDVVWNAFDGIDENFKWLVDNDIEKNFAAYEHVIYTPDPNIDFRLVPVLEVFFRRQAEELTTDYDNIFAWMPGDIVIFESCHVAVVSGLRNIWGRPYIIQHGKDPAAEEDRIFASDGMEISSHFRWPLQQ